ncbi:uncharacterized protein LOC118926575 [Manis pentadactyla]|uniref:uncharacterized protein LOC118926575 n=1 Tax=Manis pentadactyla TaxID=143292 RepID=UPI00255C8DAD|nr:uncharacterized protein LOC118926575 [Manis pentadactyla]
MHCEGLQVRAWHEVESWGPYGGPEGPPTIHPPTPCTPSSSSPAYFHAFFSGPDLGRALISRLGEKWRAGNHLHTCGDQLPGVVPASPTAPLGALGRPARPWPCRLCGSRSFSALQCPHGNDSLFSVPPGLLAPPGQVPGPRSASYPGTRQLDRTAHPEGGKKDRQADLCEAPSPVSSKRFFISKVRKLEASRRSPVATETLETSGRNQARAFFLARTWTLMTAVGSGHRLPHYKKETEAQRRQAICSRSPSQAVFISVRA